MREDISFEQHLVKKGLLSEEDFASVLLECKHDSNSFCRFAVELGFLNVHDLFKIYSFQSNSDHSIEEIALKKGFLKQDQIKEIYDEMNKIKTASIDILIQSKKISKETVEAERALFYNKSYKDEKNEQDRIKGILKKFEIFSHIRDEAFTTLSSISVLENIKSGDVVIKEGDEANCMYCIVSGSLSITKKADKRKKGFYISSLLEGSVFGEASIFEKGKRTATVIADTDSVLLRIDRYPFISFLRDFPKSSQSILIFIIQGLLQRLYLTNQDLAFERKDSVSQDDINSIIKEFYHS